MQKSAFRILFLVLLLMGKLRAQEEELWTNFNVANGLGSNNISAIKQSNNGTLWLGTYGAGISRYEDGMWRVVKPAGFAFDVSFHTILESQDGAMWFASTIGGVTRHKDERLTTFSGNDSLASSYINAMVETSDGVIWFATINGLSRFQEGRWDSLTENDSLADKAVYAIAESMNGTLWFGTASGVSRFVNGSFKNIDDLDGKEVHCIVETGDGSMWLTVDDGVSRLQNDIWTHFTQSDGLAEGPFDAIFESSDGALWVTGTNVSRFLNGSWTKFCEGGICPKSPHDVRAVAESNELTWFGTGDGLYQYRDERWFFISEGPDNVTSISETMDGALWVGTLGAGVSRRELISKTSTASSLNSASLVFESNDGALWFGTAGNGVIRMYNDSLMQFTTADTPELVSDSINAMMQSEDTTLWVGTNAGVSLYKNGVWSVFPGKGLLSNEINAILESRDGAIWFGTSRGVSRYQNDWQSFTTEQDLVNNFVLILIESADGDIWCGTLAGIGRYHAGLWTKYPEVDGFVITYVSSGLAASDGTLWFGSLGGVSRYQHGDWITYTDVVISRPDDYVAAIVESHNSALWFGTGGGYFKRYQDGIWTIFTPEDGLRHISAIIESRDGALWIVGNGVSRIQPDKTAPYTLITNGPENVTGTATPLFEFIGRDFRTPQDRLSYSYVVFDVAANPNEELWQPFSTRTTVQPVFLINGKYTFYVRSKDTWGNIDPTPARRTFVVDITAPTVTFNSHKPGDNVDESVVLIGNAFDSSPLQDFESYRLSYGPSASPDEVAQWHSDRFSPSNSTKQVQNDTLAIWDTSGLPNGAYTLWLQATDTLAHISDVYLPLEVVKSLTDIDPRDGTTLSLDTDQIQLYIPPNALQQEETLIIKETESNSLIPLDTAGVTFTNLSFAIEPASLRLQKPGTLTLGYPDVSSFGLQEQRLAIYRSLDGRSNWQRLGGLVNLQEKTITTPFDSLGVFALYEDLNDGTESDIFNVNIQPRVFSATGNSLRNKADISFDLGKASSVNIRVYNTAGRLIAVLTEGEQMNRGGNLISWSGQDFSGKSCPSGLYVVAIEADDKMQTKTVVVMNR